MSYSTVTFHFHRGNGLIARFIRWWTKGYVNHVSVEYNGCYFDADLGKILTMSNSPAKGIVESYTFQVEELSETDDRIFFYLTDSVGMPYDLKAMLGFVINKEFEHRKGMFCSEHANNVFRLMTGLNLKDRKLVSPEALRRSIMVYHFVKPVIEDCDNNMLSRTTANT